MDYGTFLRLREADWRDFGERLGRARERPRATSYDDLEFLAVRYRQILHDSSLANARFPGTGAARRLQHLALAATQFLQRDPQDAVFSLAKFWRETFPAAFARNRVNTIVAVLLFLVGAVFGLGLAAVQTSVATVLLGPRVLDDLSRGHLWTESLVSSVPPSLSSSAIARNNIGVALLGFAGGALAGLGSLYILILNGFLLGAIFGVTLHYSMAGQLFEFVSAHGPLEITLIIVTAAAGLRMGRAIVEPSDEPRWKALASAGRDAQTILLGCLPWFVPLGIIEGFLSPSPSLAPVVKLLLGISILTLFLLTCLRPLSRKEEP
jgi:uncharacterized membrane protein SpoIIM required for sporulation